MRTWKASASAKSADERKELRDRKNLVVDALGDGSDFTAFQDFAGISTLDVGYGGEEDGTQYHSIYDDFYWYTHFVGHGFRLTVARWRKLLAQP